MRKLHKSRDNKVIAGVAGGLAESFGVSATLVRVGFVLLTLPGGVPGPLLYILLWILLPKERASAAS